MSRSIPGDPHAPQNTSSHTLISPIGSHDDLINVDHSVSIGPMNAKSCNDIQDVIPQPYERHLSVRINSNGFFNSKPLKPPKPPKPIKRSQIVPLESQGSEERKML